MMVYIVVSYEQTGTTDETHLLEVYKNGMVALDKVQELEEATPERSAVMYWVETRELIE